MSELERRVSRVMNSLRGVEGEIGHWNEMDEAERDACQFDWEVDAEAQIPGLVEMASRQRLSPVEQDAYETFVQSVNRMSDSMREHGYTVPDLVDTRLRLAA